MFKDDRIIQMYYNTLHSVFTLSEKYNFTVNLQDDKFKYFFYATLFLVSKVSLIYIYNIQIYWIPRINFLINFFFKISLSSLFFLSLFFYYQISFINFLVWQQWLLQVFLAKSVEGGYESELFESNRVRNSRGNKENLLFLSRRNFEIDRWEVQTPHWSRKIQQDTREF